MQKLPLSFTLQSPSSCGQRTKTAAQNWSMWIWDAVPPTFFFFFLQLAYHLSIKIEWVTLFSPFPSENAGGSFFSLNPYFPCLPLTSRGSSPASCNSAANECRNIDKEWNTLHSSVSRPLSGPLALRHGINFQSSERLFGSAMSGLSPRSLGLRVAPPAALCEGGKYKNPCVKTSGK